MEKQDFSCLLPRSWETIIDQWLDEDVPSFDYGGFVVGMNSTFNFTQLLTSLKEMRLKRPSFGLKALVLYLVSYFSQEYLKL